MILLDTHVLLWWQAGGERLTARASRAIAASDAVLISPVSCWEVAMLVVKQRVRLDRDVYLWVRDLHADERIQPAPLSVEASVSAALLTAEGFEGDPADAFLYATARELVVPLVTKDQALRTFARQRGDVRTIW